MKLFSFLLLLAQDTNTYERSPNLGAGFVTWSIINLVILVGAFILVLLLILRVLKYLNLKIKLMQRELDNK